MTSLHVFDMDGTLLAGTTASLEIARFLRCEAQLVELEDSFRRREIDTRGFAQRIHRLWDELTEDDVASAFEGSPFLEGIADVCSDIRSRGEHSLVVSMSPDFFARLLLRFGFDEVVASRFPALPFASPITPENILIPQDKVDIVEDGRKRKGIPPQRCIAYGDSMSDAPLFEHLGNTVAVNADGELTRLARAHYTGPSSWTPTLRGGRCWTPSTAGLRPVRHSRCSGPSRRSPAGLAAGVLGGGRGGADRVRGGGSGAPLSHEIL
ncbi:HAD family hydrolase [Allosalinactinospora lopnorensis]|uniref:HAD family hydrolase n=1 Tax=Allosalinactinospora lopnorensis TaxID=1352348 RepID=UPI000A8732F1|nr:HAD family phosphatase [Allosalinactinospora lopnorensis]